MNKMNTITNEIIEALSTYANYIEHYYVESREKDMAITKIQECVFWLTFLNDSGD